MAIPRPKSWFKRLAGRTPLYDAVLALFVAFTGWSQAYRLYVEGWKGLGALLASLRAGAVVVSIAKAVVQWRSAGKEESIHELRTKEPVVGSRENDDYESYIQELVRTWHYTEADARRLNPATMSYLAVPLENTRTREIEGVVYLDSTDRDFFDDSCIVSTVHACAGIAQFVARRYAVVGRS